MNKKVLILIAAGAFGAFAATAAPALAQTLEDIAAKKDAESAGKLGFGFLGTYEGAMGLNKDRPEYLNTILLSPHLKIGSAMKAQLNMSVNKAFLDRQENAYGWYPDDFSLELGHSKIFKDELTGITLAARARYYIPVSKASRDVNSYGQLRGYLKLSTAIWKFYLAAEVNAQKYMSEYTTTPTTEYPGTVEWFKQAGKDEYVENQTDFGLGETFTLGFTVVEGLDLSLIWGLYQSKHYRGVAGLGDSYGSSYLQEPRWTTWGHIYRCAADITYGIGSIPGMDKNPLLKDSILSNLYLSLGYSLMAPQLKRGGAESNLDPFDPKFGSLYLDLSIIY